MSFTWGAEDDSDPSAVEFGYTVANNTGSVVVTVSSTDTDIDAADAVDLTANPVVIDLSDLDSGESVTLKATVDGQSFDKVYTMP